MLTHIAYTTQATQKVKAPLIKNQLTICIEGHNKIETTHFHINKCYVSSDNTFQTYMITLF